MFLRIARWVPANGVFFAVLVIVAAIVSGEAPGTDASDTSWTSYYADSGNRHPEQISFFLIGLAGLCFLQFLGSLRGALARAEGEPARITTAAIASGTAFITLAVSAHVVATAVSWTAGTFGDDFTVDPDTARMLNSLGYMLFVMSLFAAAGMAVAAATLAFVSPAMPTWLAWFSALAAVAGLFGIVFFPALVVLAWIVALSVWLLLPQRAARATVPA
jgi:hypothetical protein